MVVAAADVAQGGEDEEIEDDDDGDGEESDTDDTSAPDLSACPALVAVGSRFRSS